MIKNNFKFKGSMKMKKILAGILLVAVLVSLTGCAKAENEVDISISPSSQAFIVSNMVPEDSVTNTITITNKGSLDVGGIKISIDLKSFDPVNDGSDLSEVLNLQLVYDSYDVTADVANKLGDKVPPLTMKELESGYALEGVNRGESKDLQIMVTFDPYAGNEYKEDSVNVTFKFEAMAAPTPIHSRGGRRAHSSNSTPPPAPIDTTPPIISNVTVTIERSVIITWDTNEKSDSRVKCGIKSGEYTIEEHNTSYTLFHVIPLKQIRLKNIYENTTYYFVVNSTDPGGNSAQTEEYMFVLTPSGHRRAIMPFILQIPPTLYPHMWWLLLAAIIVLIITVMVMPKYKSRRNFNSLIGKPVETEILIYLYRIFPKASRPVNISGRTNIDLNGVLEALHIMSNKSTLERLLRIGFVDTVECEGEVCYCISKRGKSVMDGLK
jgi:predicted transcriptional regulator with HTH domain